MSMKMSRLLKKGFDSSKCITLLQLTLQRIKILRNKRSIIAKQSRDDVAKLLEKGQDGSARVRVEHVFREENIVAAYDLVEQYCQLIINRIETIKSQKECPSDLKEAIASLIYAAPRCGDLQELQKVREIFTSKYGTEFSVTAIDLRPDCGVNTQIIKKLSSLPPNSNTKLKLMKEIAAECKIDWNYEKAAADSFKGSNFKGAGDLLDGPKHFVSASQVPKVDTPTVADKQKPVSISMHPDGLKGQASSVTHNAIASPAAPSKAKMPSLDPSPHNVHLIANHEISTSTQLKAQDHAVRAQNASSKTDSPGNSRVHLKPDHSTPSPKLDPYALAKAEGRMDYTNVTDFMGQDQETEKVLKVLDLKQEGRDTRAYDKYAKQQTGEAQDRKASKDAPNHEEGFPPQRSKEKGEGSRNHNMISSHTRLQEKESTSKNQEDRLTSQELSEGKSTRRTGIVLSELTQERRKPPQLTREIVTEETEFLDLETAAEVAFVSAARAAEAAKAAIDMVRTNSIGRSGRKMVNANSLQRGQYLKSSFGSGKRENDKVTEGTSKVMDPEHSFERENLGGKSGEVENESNQGNVDSHRDIMHSTINHQMSGPRARSSSDMIEDAFKYVESEKTSSSQRYIQTSTHPEMLNTKAEAHVFSHVWDEATQSSRNDPDWLGIHDLENEEASGTHELGSKEAFINTPIRRFSEPYREGVKKHEPAQTYSSSTRKQESSFDHTELHQEKKHVQYDSLMPQFDDYSSDDSSEEETPFYTKGRAAMARRDYEQVAERASFNKPKQSMPTFSSFIKQGSDDYVDERSNSIIQRNVQQESLHLDDYAESVDVFSQKSSSSPLLHLDDYAESVDVFSQKSSSGPYQHSNLVTNSIQSDVHEHSQKPRFDDYTESVDLSSRSSKSPVRSHTTNVSTGFKSEDYAESVDVFSQKSSSSPYQHSNLVTNSIQSDVHEHSQKPRFDDYTESVDLSSRSSKSPVRSHTSNMSTRFRSDDLVISPIVENDIYRKPTSRRKLRWQSSTSEESDFHSQSDEVSPTLGSVNLPSHREVQSGYGDGYLATQESHKLAWGSSVSEELDFPSEPSLEAGKLRWKSTTSEEFNSQPSVEARKLKPSSRREDETRAFKQGDNPETTTQVAQASTGKSYHGLSRRSVRSPLPKQNQDVLPPASTNSPSVGDGNYYRYR